MTRFETGAVRREEVIGDARLLLGDALEILPTLGPVDAVVTDPPYGMAFRSNYRRERHAAIVNDEAVDCLHFACGLQAAHCSYVFCRWDSLVTIPKPRSLVTWVKNNWSMGDLAHEHARQTEVIAFYAGPRHYFPRGRPQDVVRAPRTENGYHPTEKPVQLMAAIVDWTAGTVVDPFMGSGSTGVACVNLGRAFVGIEIDEKHFETSLRRIEAAYAQPRLFDEPPPRPVQEAMDV